MIHYGDITKISGYDMPIVDCVVGGSPCQNFSVAGNREGLDGNQSVLFVEQLRVIKEMRERDVQRGRTGEFIRPRFMVWENVPGAFSSNKGQDFRKVLEETAKIVQEDAVIPMPPKDKWTTSGCIVGDGWSIAWRVFDAQFWGVPQRRRRIALVADFGGGCAQEILFVKDSLRRDFEKSGTERKTTSADAQGCIGVHDSTRKITDVVEGLDCYNQQMTGDKTTCLRSKSADTDHIPCVVMDRSAYNQGENAKYNIGIDENGVAFSHIAKGPGAVAYCIGNGQVNDAVCPDKELCKTLNCMDDPMKIMIAISEPVICMATQQGGAEIRTDDKAPTLTAAAGMSGNNQPVICLQGNQVDRANTSVCNGSGFKEGTSYTLNTMDRHAVCYKKPHYIVRRLTPLECERLQGFPDGWTDIGEYIDSKGKKKKTSDSARYKALGNSIALPSWKWVIKRISALYERDATLASLFDGIGGFPYLWEQINGKGSCLWASEIEDFPIAVTKTRIG